MGARTLPVIKWSGGKIAAPGIYDMPIEAYHSDCCAGPSISSSGLRAIEDQSPAHYWSGSYLNPARTPQEPSSAFDFGRAAHVLLLGEAGFRDQFVVRPAEWTDWRTKSAQDWRAAQVASGKTVVTDGDLQVIKGMARSLAGHPLVSSGLLNGEIEKSLIWQDRETGVWLKARPDALPVNADVVADLKTCASADARSVRASIIDYGYHMQLALIGMGIEAIQGRKLGNDDYVLVFVEKKPPHCVNVKPIDCDFIAYGRMQIRRAVRRFADCINRGDWPGYDDDGVTAVPPKFFADRMESQIQSGELDNTEPTP